MNISELVDVDLLRNNIEEGFISERSHRDYDLTILNYTPAAAYARNWNAATRICRGMVVDGTGEIYARPFPKFFNMGEPDADAIGMSEMVSVLDKADGSLLIVFKYMDDIVVATRGSFHSEQADLARKFMNAERYDPDSLDHNTTYLMEVVGPSNRIVLNYESDHLIRIADVNNLTGEYNLAPYGEPFTDIDPVQVFGHMTKFDVLEIPPRPNAEGLVLYTPDGRVQKVKQSDYIKAHAVVTNTTPLSVWKALSSGDSVSDICELIPDEFYSMVEDYATPLISEFEKVKQFWYDEYTLIYQDSDSRKEFADKAKFTSNAGVMFSLFDGKSIDEAAWRQVRPH